MSKPHIRTLYEAHRRGKPRAREELHRYLYPLLHTFVQDRVHHRLKGSTLQTTLILHDLLLIIEKRTELDIKNMGSVYAFTAKVLREYLADYYRRKSARKRGGGLEKQSLDEVDLPAGESSIDFFLDYDLAMRKLEDQNPQSRSVMDLKVIGGLSNQEIAQLLDMTEYEVKKTYGMSRVLIGRQLKQAKQVK